jgi:hypothetical protein
MENIDKARKSVELTMKHVYEGDTSQDMLNFGMLTAIADATIAQAEELKRIGDLLSIFLADYDPNGNKAQGRTSEDWLLAHAHGTR